MTEVHRLKRALRNSEKVRAEQAQKLKEQQEELCERDLRSKHSIDSVEIAKLRAQAVAVEKLQQKMEAYRSRNRGLQTELAESRQKCRQLERHVIQLEKKVSESRPPIRRRRSNRHQEAKRAR